MSTQSLNSFGSRRTLIANGKQYDYFSLPVAQTAGLPALGRLPASLKILLENLLRFEDNNTVRRADIEALASWNGRDDAQREIAFRPARVLMQDFTGVPAVADLAAMRNTVLLAGKNPDIINPLSPVDLVIDHSVMVDTFGTASAFADNVAIEMERNQERYRFLRWGQQAFRNFRVVPPGTGICHQVNLEYLAKVVWTADVDGVDLAFPDTLVGTDSHTTMINGLGVLGWGVGGIEAEAAMLGQPISMLIPEVIGFKLSGRMKDGITATDLVLTVVQMLRRKGVVDKFVEFYGDGLDALPLADRATIANMAPEYGATCGFFPIDAETIAYLRLTGRDTDTIALTEAYARAQGMWREPGAEDPTFTDTLSLDLASVEPSLAGPKRPQDRVLLSSMRAATDAELDLQGKADSKDTRIPVAGTSHTLGHGDVVIAAITSCTNTSNPAVMLAAGLLAKKALAAGLVVQPWVKTSLAPGSTVVTEYLNASGLQAALDTLGFNLVGYGCTTCIGNSGPLSDAHTQAIADGNLIVCSVLSGNRNFEGRVHQEVRANWLASPPLVVAFALAGSTRIDLSKDPIGKGSNGRDVFLADIWPSNDEIRIALGAVSADMFKRMYADVFTGPPAWRDIDVSKSNTYAWGSSTYIKQPPFFSPTANLEQPVEVRGARILALLGDSVTTDHISPAGEIQAESPAGHYLQQNGVPVAQFNSYGSRRGNHEVMMRGTFANIRIRNELVPGKEGGYSRHAPSGDVLAIYDVAMRYAGEGSASAGTPLVIVAGKEYGTGSSRDWAAKGTRLLGVKAVIAETFERIHRSNLVGMGVLPLTFKEGTTRKTLGLTGDEVIDIKLPAGETKVRAGMDLMLVIRVNAGIREVPLNCRLNTDNEVEYFKSGGILQYVLNNLMRSA